jgi:hypothetical protein
MLFLVMRGAKVGFSKMDQVHSIISWISPVTDRRTDLVGIVTFR